MSMIVTGFVKINSNTYNCILQQNKIYIMYITEFQLYNVKS